ncbi:MAG TPA: peroxiredoxin [Burkholderiaceae bacterium]|nr:peroxiredoxin [Burkholderiaceae bacterium]
MIQRMLIAAGVAASIVAPAAASAALHVGDAAPPFTTQASLGGTVYTYSLQEQLKKGPVVLYFYPAAFTTGCTIEAHEFADAMDRYQALGASVVGVSHDSIDTLNRFSVSECRSKFPVAADADQSIMKAYDAVLWLKPQYANRTSYVIAPDGKIIYEYTALSPDKHVENTLEAVRHWREAHKAP